METEKQRRVTNPLRYSCLVWALAATATFASCSKDDAASDKLLPDGKYPMTFTAAVEGLTITRATTDDSWTGSETVAVTARGVVKQYKVATDGKLTTTDPLYWQNTTETVGAWYPYNDGVKPTAETIRVKADQSSSDNYQKSDFLEASVDATFGNDAALTFTHRTAKVSVTLTNGTGITEAEVATATVSLVNLAGVESGTTVTPSESNKTYTALVTPQNCLGKQFICVTVGTGVYYYTPAEGEANLTAGKQHTYRITVLKSEIVVAIDNSIPWTDGGTSQGVGNAALFRVETPTTEGIPAITVGGDATLQSAGVYSVPSGKSFTISYAVTDFATTKGFPVASGLCDVTRTYNSSANTFTFTYTRIRSDLKLAYDIHGEPDDFYCTDASGNAYIIPGSVSPLTDSQKAACLGIVFQKKNPIIDDLWLGDDHPGCTHGLVVALHDADGDNTMQWPSATYDDMKLRYSYNSSQGYSYTKALKNWNQTILPIEKLAGYEQSHPAPAASSGWYWPFDSELAPLHWKLSKEDTSEECTQVNEQLQAAGGTTLGNEMYWSSKMDGWDRAAAVGYTRSQPNPFITLNQLRGYSYKVRYILAF